MNDYRSKLLKDPAYALEAAKGKLIMDVTEAVCGILEKEKKTRKKLAEKMDKTKGYISQLLNGNRNMTLATLAEMAFCLGYDLEIRLKKKESAKKRIILKPVKVDMETGKCDYEAKVA